jgi:hypothetical protein
VQQLPLVNQVRCGFHLDAIGKQPQLALTNQVIVEMGSGGEHRNFFISEYSEWFYFLYLKLQLKARSGSQCQQNKLEHFKRRNLFNSNQSSIIRILQIDKVYSE